MNAPIWSPSPNFSSRHGRSVRALVIHTTAGFFPSDLNWLKNPNPKDEDGNPVPPVSAHEIIAPDGQVYQLVSGDQSAWANGIINGAVTNRLVREWRATPVDPAWTAGLPNLESYSIEVSGLGRHTWTSAQWVSLRVRARLAAQRYGIDDEWRVLRHAEIDRINRPNCPGPADEIWSSFVLDTIRPVASTDALLDAEYARLGGLDILGSPVHKYRLTWATDWTTFDDDVLVCERGVVSIAAAQTRIAQALVMDAATGYLTLADILVPIG